MLNILVICTGNSCRSIIGEALFNSLGKDRIEAFSAGSKPLGRLNPDAISLLERHGLSTSGFSSKSWDIFEGRKIDLAITVCDSAAGETCPVYINKIPKAHWGLADPSHVSGSEEIKRLAFEETYRIFELRIRRMLSLPLEIMSKDELESKLNLIGKLV